ncbi:peptide methionine sulfoxide reductase [Leptolyngbya sp. Heron Island J]|uniref:peptide-methionine (S)-S-oxide reductase MsrA n=1 Tax=Leptolyngbya sp. Heron Island J TaxID=1385935 RepID=UPI0003B95C9D|nr:peptide-methionine (S)-S-oxide reductase MsrA [Leptolyngbya sp. Heron Island J]ESA37532.1 peptide methionine sulfoxide reductase [Leptolyngbya sp. Heron Island J]
MITIFKLWQPKWLLRQVLLSLLIGGLWCLGASAALAATAQATFAGGCFWCMEHPFDELQGVIETTSGYMGGTVEKPSYRQVSSGTTGHAEVVQVEYDPDIVSYETLMNTFWHNVDPLDGMGQFCDKGSQYRSIVFYHNDTQRQLAETSKQTIGNQFNQSIVTDILSAATFYPAEDYHQNYYQTHPARYRLYRFGCGRDQRLAELWGNSPE